jgi:hypothetical protein
MKFSKAISLCAAAVLMSLGAIKASAATVDLTYTGTSPGAKVQYDLGAPADNSNYNTITAGRFTFSASGWEGGTSAQDLAVQNLVGSTIKTWCVQLNESLGSSPPYTYSLHGGIYGSYQSPLSSSTVMDRVRALFNQFYGTLNLSSNIDSGAFQVALWEVLSDSSFSLTANNFMAKKITSGTAGELSDSNAAINKAVNILSTLDVNGYKNAGTYVIYQLHNDYKQDQIFAIPGTTTNIPPVPVPAALPSGLALLAGLAVYRKLRRKSNEA